MRGLVSAIRTLTAIPCLGEDADDLASALPWFPITGLLIGMVLYVFSAAVLKITDAEFIPVISAAVVLGGALLTRGIHLDGLADWADGFWGSMRRERVLEIMKDSCIGSYGAIALITVLLVKWVCITYLLRNSAGIWIVAAAVISRTIQVNLAANYPYARSTDGTGAPFVRKADKSHAANAATISAITLMLILHSFIIPLTALLLGWIISILIGNWSRRRIGGITGDVIGAGSELTETAILVYAVFIYAS